MIFKISANENTFHHQTWPPQAILVSYWPIFSSPGHRPCELLSWVSVRRPSVSFSHLTLLLWNRWTDFNQTCQKCSLDGPLPDLCFWCWFEIQHSDRSTLCPFVNFWLKSWSNTLQNIKFLDQKLEEVSRTDERVDMGKLICRSTFRRGATGTECFW
jgi:hypothetical protein